jgi:deoxyribodipyrimidine photo-lyase
LPTQLVWLRQDLRLHDQPALVAAAAAGAVLPVYILDDQIPGGHRMGAAQRWWLHHSLIALRDDLAKHGVPLVLRRGRASTELALLVRQTGATAIHALRHYEPWWQLAEKEAAQQLPLVLHEGNQFANPRSILNGTGQRYRVFTPWFRKLLDHMPPPVPSPCPEQIAAPGTVPPSDELGAWGLLPRNPDWSGGFADWRPGERGALAAFRRFLPILPEYDEQRNFPGRPGTSRLSPHIHFGEISPATLWHHAATSGGAKAHSFLSEIAWREHGLNLIDQMPGYAQHNGRALFNRFPWRTGTGADADFRAWTSGRTGFPVVDAGMRELWQTGWMHNPVRMITASFLVKHLLIDWRRGERWFWDTLLDADLGANAMNWQYVAGTGIDAPVFARIMAPLIQSAKFEMADYIRRFVPEIADLPDGEIHAPPEQDRIARGYPPPLISHEAARARALAAWDACRHG